MPTATKQKAPRSRAEIVAPFAKEAALVSAKRNAALERIAEIDAAVTAANAAVLRSGADPLETQAKLATLADERAELELRVASFPAAAREMEAEKARTLEECAAELAAYADLKAAEAEDAIATFVASGRALFDARLVALEADNEAGNPAGRAPFATRQVSFGKENIRDPWSRIAEDIRWFEAGLPVGIPPTASHVPGDPEPTKSGVEQAREWQAAKRAAHGAPAVTNSSRQDALVAIQRTASGSV
ncbi:MAG TPA: hypothetical protein VGG41_07030 [Solirubrobacteraceae bacterium]|jgi:hypothetical protein